jgi:hypothetical protein
MVGAGLPARIFDARRGRAGMAGGWRALSRRWLAWHGGRAGGWLAGNGGRALAGGWRWQGACGRWHGGRWRAGWIVNDGAGALPA